METKDRFGKTIRVGDRVKVIGLSDAFMNSLLPEDHRQISQMMGGVFVVEEIDDGGQAGLLNGGASAAEKPMRTGSVSLPQKWNSLKLMGHRLPPARGGHLRSLAILHSLPRS